MAIDWAVKTEEEYSDPPVRALPALTDMSGAWDLAEQPIPQLFNECIPRGYLSLMASEPGVGKSTLALGLGLSVGLYRSFVSGFTPSRPGRALILAGEDGAHPVAKRIRHWCEHVGVTRAEFEAAVSDGRLHFICGESAPFIASKYGALTETAAYSEMMELCAANQYDFVVVDSLIQWAGVPSENDNSQMDYAGNRMVRLAAASDCVVMALCHTNKASDRTGEIGLHTIRGGSALAGKIRWGVQLVKLTDKEAKGYGIHEYDRWRYLRMANIKDQYNPPGSVPVYLERGEGGILEAVKLCPQAEANILPHLVAELRSHPIPVSFREIYRGSGAEMADFRERVARRAKVERISNEMMKAALQAGIDLKQLREAPHPSRRTSVLEVA